MKVLSSSIASHLQEIRTWSPSRSDADGTFMYIDLSAVDQELKKIVSPRVTKCSEAPSRARQLVANGDVLVSTVRPNLNGVARVPAELNGATASTGFCVLRPDSTTLDGGYLFHWVKSPQFVKDMTLKATGASYPAVSDRIVTESTLPLPPLEEQQRIAAILDAAENLRAERRIAIGKLDELVQSIFLEMFGDPGANPRQWPRYSLRDVGKVSTGSTPPSAKSGMFGGPIPFVTPGDLESNAPVKRSLTAAGAEESRMVRSGATLVCCIGATIGKIDLAPVDCAFNQQINAVEWVTKVDDLYGFSVLRFFKPTIAAWGASTTLPILKKSSFERIEIPVPPIELQKLFASRYRAICNARTLYGISHDLFGQLFLALQSDAFRGEI